MAIYRLLQNTPLAETGHLIAAYELTLRALNLVDRNDPLTEVIADRSYRPQRPGRDIEARREVAQVELGPAHEGLDLIHHPAIRSVHLKKNTTIPDSRATLTNNVTTQTISDVSRLGIAPLLAASRMK